MADVNHRYENLQIGKIYIFTKSECEDALRQAIGENITNLSLLSQLGVEYVDDETLDCNYEMVIRRVNLGNLNRYAIQCYRDYSYVSFCECAPAWNERHLSDVADFSVGNLYNDNDDGFDARFPTMRQPRLMSARRGLFGLISQKLGKKKAILDADMPYECSDSCVEPAICEPEAVDEQEVRIREADEKRHELLNKISALVLQYVTSFGEMPSAESISALLEGKFTLGNDNLSRLTVNGDFKIFLSDYNEVEIKLFPLSKVLYILFLLHPEGIVLKNIAEYRNELIAIYGYVKPGRDDEKAKESIDVLIDPFSNSLSENISKINRTIKTVILNPEISKNYTISGTRGGAYRIVCRHDLVKLPRMLL